MKTILTITDVTGMAPPFVCVAGVNDEGKSIRLRLNKGRLDEHWLCHNGFTVIRPFARVGFWLLSPHSEPPHTEDWNIDPCFLEAHGILDPALRVRFLTPILDPAVAAIFGTEILSEPGTFVLKGQGERSLGTIQTARIYEVNYRCFDQVWDCRIRFADPCGEDFSLKVKDLTFCAYLDYLREQEKLDCEQINLRVTRELREKPCFLRIGLARGWAAYPDRCYLQITGVFTFPDFLQGRWFADFRPPREYKPGQLTYHPATSQGRQVKETSLSYSLPEEIPF